MKNILIIILLLSISACDNHKEYIKTNAGLIESHWGNCNLGLMFNWDGVNMLDKHKNPITCTGKVRLSEDQYRLATEE